MKQFAKIWVYQKIYYNKKYQSKIFHMKDRMWFNLHNIIMQRSNKKFNLKYERFCKIIEKINTQIYYLKFFMRFSVHNVFHVSLFHKYKKLIKMNNKTHHSIHSIMNMNCNYQIEKISNSKYENREFKYLIDWENYDLKLYSLIYHIIILFRELSNESIALL